MATRTSLDRRPDATGPGTAPSLTDPPVPSGREPSDDPPPTTTATPDAAPAQQGWRERKKDLTRHALHRAALELVAAHGVGAVTTEAVAEAAQVSPRTFFNYFPTKESAILGVDLHQPDRILARFAERPADEPPAEAVRACLVAWAEEFTSDRELWALRRTIVRSDAGLLQAMGAITSRIEATLTEAVAERMGVDHHSDLRPGVLVATSLAAMRVGLGLSRERDVPVAEALTDAFALLAGTEIWATR